MNKLFFLKLLLIAVAFCMQFSLLAQNKNSDKQFILSGNIIGRDNGYIYLEYLNTQDVFVNDSAKITHGNFGFAGLINSPYNALLRLNKKSRSATDSNLVNIFIEPKKMNIILKINNFKNAKITGSKSQREMEYVRLKELNIMNDMDSLYAIFFSLRDSSKINKLYEDSIKLIQGQLDLLNGKMNSIQDSFIATHPNSYVSAYLLMTRTYNLSYDSLKMLYTNFSSPVKNCLYAKKVAASLNGSVGVNAIDFTATEANGNLIKLSSFKNKNYVLLDFWATWCVPCRANNPRLISIYNKYHSKGLEIIGIANDDNNKKGWRQAIIDDNTNIWHQILKGVGDEDIFAKYGVLPIPATILIDKNGKIVFRSDLNNDESKKQLDEKLAEEFGF